MYIGSTVECDLSHAAYSASYLLIENSSCVAILCFLPKKTPKPRQIL